MTGADFHALTRTELLERLDVLNAALGRRGCDPLLTTVEAAALPQDNLAGMVAATADRLVTVTKAMGGLP